MMAELVAQFNKSCLINPIAPIRARNIHQHVGFYMEGLILGVNTIIHAFLPLYTPQVREKIVPRNVNNLTGQRKLCVCKVTSPRCA